MQTCAGGQQVRLPIRLNRPDAPQPPPDQQPHRRSEPSHVRQTSEKP
jgi:hypothetical protein